MVTRYGDLVNVFVHSREDSGFGYVRTRRRRVFHVGRVTLQVTFLRVWLSERLWEAGYYRLAAALSR